MRRTRSCSSRRVILFLDMVRDLNFKSSSFHLFLSPLLSDPNQLVCLQRRATASSDAASERAKRTRAPALLLLSSNCRHRRRRVGRRRVKWGSGPGVGGESCLCVRAPCGYHTVIVVVTGWKITAARHRRRRRRPPLSRRWWRWLRDCLVTSCSDCEIILRQWMRCSVVNGTALIDFKQRRQKEQKV